jgi:hypothetical protein
MWILATLGAAPLIAERVQEQLGISTASGTRPSQSCTMLHTG